ncbi:DUF2256 domain-containing protein [Pleionea sediminis]|uniref:DUF2256 domain-containing protein n=1 Tax=Pleionea sediminis TaxID=2569479 RepID=UPI001186C6B7|nr:DUF2256 domain-containing protein [Pleionea sediminis]
MHKKLKLPKKICLVCHRPFEWRKKWSKCWDDVLYCSKRCRNNSSKLGSKIHPSFSKESK